MMQSAKKETVSSERGWECSNPACKKKISKGETRFYQNLAKDGEAARWISACGEPCLKTVGGTYTEGESGGRFIPRVRTTEQKVADVEAFHKFYSSIYKKPEGRTEYDNLSSIEYAGILRDIFNGKT